MKYRACIWLLILDLEVTSKLLHGGKNMLRYKACLLQNAVHGIGRDLKLPGHTLGGVARLGLIAGLEILP